MNAAEIPAAARAPDQPANRSSGVRKIPPPVPTSPERSPMTPPIPTAGKNGTRGDGSSAAAILVLAALGVLVAVRVFHWGRALDRSVGT